MATKLQRFFQKVFGDNGSQSHFGQFGSRVSSPPGLNTKDPTAIQALSAFDTNGWLDAINAANKAPFLEDMNGLFFLAFRQIAYILQDGIPEWNTDTPYFIGSIVRKTGTTELYGSLTDSNTGNALPSQTSNAFWNYLNPQTVAPGVISDYGGSSAPFGWLACDGSVYAQATYPALYAAIGSTWNTGGEGGGNFRLPDLRGRTTIGSGTGSGLSARTLAQILGEETHILTLAEIPAHNHNYSDPGHYHMRSKNQAIHVDNTGSTAVDVYGSPFALDGSSLTSSSTTGITFVSQGGSGAHNNMQPSAVTTKIIKT